MEVTLEMIDPELREIAEPFMGATIDNDEAFIAGMTAGAQMLDLTKPDDAEQRK